MVRAPAPDRPLPPGVAAIDPTKLFIDVTPAGLSGFEVARRLYQTAGIGVELATDTGVLMIITAADTPNDLDRLGDRLLSFTASLPKAVSSSSIPTGSLPKIAGECAASPRDAFFATTERIAFINSRGRIAAEPIVPYPPGVASLWPGERIAGDTAAFREYVRNTGASVQAGDPSLETVLVLR
ncbi:hypothetical protein AJ87_08165 [Rhizobium yanglingense]|nr:hypothetical protein AJ87_08165 [Rhizobium yanglingense]